VLEIRHFSMPVSNAARPARERWEAHTTGYHYALERPDGPEIVAYHWHPAGRSHVSEPHIHWGAGAGALIPELAAAHLLTGHVGPAAVLRLAIERFHVAPRRSDWSSIFARFEDEPPRL
jgi:hypothetical protein